MISFRSLREGFTAVQRLPILNNALGYAVLRIPSFFRTFQAKRFNAFVLAPVHEQWH
jgi:hypothetical protein